MERDASSKQPLPRAKRREPIQQPSEAPSPMPEEEGTLWPAVRATTANAADSPATVNPYVERLKLATLLYGISLFMSWGVLYWVIWYDGYYWDPYFFEIRLLTGFGEMLEWLDYTFVQAGMFDQYLWMFEQSGPFPTLFILLRDLMPFAFIVAFTVAWRKREPSRLNLRKLEPSRRATPALWGSSCCTSSSNSVQIRISVGQGLRSRCSGEASGFGSQSSPVSSFTQNSYRIQSSSCWARNHPPS